MLLASKIPSVTQFNLSALQIPIHVILRDDLVRLPLKWTRQSSAEFRPNPVQPLEHKQQETT